MTSRGDRPIVLFCYPAIGDFVRCHTAVRLLAERFPDRPIDVVTSPRAADLARFMPHVRTAHGFAGAHNVIDLSERLRLAARLRAEQYGTAVVLPASFKAALVPFLARIPERIGWFGECRYPLINRPRFGRRQTRCMRDEVVALALERGAAVPARVPEPSLVVPRSEVEALLQRNGLRGSTVIAMIPNGISDLRGWGADNYISLARMCVARGWRVCLVGHDREREMATMIKRAAPVLDFVGGALSGAVVQLAAATAVVGADGGLIHLAAALGKPVVAIFGLSDPRLIGPVNSRVRFLVPDSFTGVCRDWTAGGAAIRRIAPERVMEVLAATEHLDLAK